MFEIVAAIYNGRELVKYEILDLKTKRRKIVSIEEARGIAIAGAFINAKFNGRGSNLSGINGFDLRTLPRKQDRRKNKKRSIAVITGNRLFDMVYHNSKEFPIERYITKHVYYYNTAHDGSEICALYGLRRTGKTVCMLHTIRRLVSSGKKNVAYISLTEESSLADLYSILDKFVDRRIRYIFIDEITAVNGFIQSSALLSDKYAKLGIKITIAGTDSFIIGLASRNELYDRIIRIDTSYIGYKEYARIRSGASILDYVKTGGTLQASKIYDLKRANEYIDTAITNNIINSLLRAGNVREYGHLLELEKRGLLKKAIETAIENTNNEITASIITDSYTNGSLGSATKMIEHIFDINSALDKEEIEDRVRYRLSIVKEDKSEFSEDYIEELKDFLIEIGLIRVYNRYVFSNRRVRKVETIMFNIPALRYHQATSLIEELAGSESFYNLPVAVRNQLKNKIIEDIEGNLIETEVILSEIERHKRDSGTEVTQVIYNSKEIDMLINCEDGIFLFEVKRSEKVVDDQAKWLVDNELNEYVEVYFGRKVEERTVLYNGDKAVKNIKGKEVKYLNLSEFLF